LSLNGPVVRSEFEAALNGIDPKTGERLTSLGGRQKSHSAGWDMTFSAPKSVSVLWALSDPDKRAGIERAQRSAVAVATKHLEQTAAFARRGKGGAIREATAGLLMARFDHHTSRDLDPQLHTHVFVFNFAPCKDETWGAIVSRELYKAQKQAGAIYREALATELERHGYALERSANSFRVIAIPRSVERAFSKRRQAIEAAAEAHGYRTPKGMEMAAFGHGNRSSVSGAMHYLGPGGRTRGQWGMSSTRQSPNKLDGTKLTSPNGQHHECRRRRTSTHPNGCATLRLAMRPVNSPP